MQRLLYKVRAKDCCGSPDLIEPLGLVDGTRILPGSYSGLDQANAILTEPAPIERGGHVKFLHVCQVCITDGVMNGAVDGSERIPVGPLGIEVPKPAPPH